ncbi:MAG: alpha/beta hydrolase [Bacteroidota bacterium]
MKTLVVTAALLFLSSYSVIAQDITIKEEVSISVNDSLTLAGEIEYPNKEGKFPAAILIWGSGPHTRDQSISETPIFKQISNFLVAKDMVVMRMDKRGYGKSTGNFRSEDNYTTRDLANDINLAYQYLNRHSMVDTTKIGLIGHSEGSIIASMLGAEDKSIDWMILFGPTGVSGKEIELEQRAYEREKLGMSKEVGDALSEVWKEYIEFIKSGYKNDTLYYDIGKRFLMAHGLEENDDRITPELIDQLLDGFKTKWYQYFYGNDNSKHLEKISIPLLAIMGGADKHTSVKLNFEPLYNALEKANNKMYKIVILADNDHFFFKYNGKRLEKHRPGEMKMSDEFRETIISWLETTGIIKN